MLTRMSVSRREQGSGLTGFIDSRVVIRPPDSALFIRNWG
ncbi:MAG: hypothetical protein QOE55_7110, partial [Acidobacteriaceae bacterium]|nr:hypothetical protein [Acidobacteriaceae bacterium]